MSIWCKIFGHKLYFDRRGATSGPLHCVRLDCDYRHEFESFGQKIRTNPKSLARPQLPKTETTTPMPEGKPPKPPSGPGPRKVRDSIMYPNEASARKAKENRNFGTVADDNIEMSKGYKKGCENMREFARRHKTDNHVFPADDADGIAEMNSRSIGRNVARIQRRVANKEEAGIIALNKLQQYAHLGIISAGTGDGFKRSKKWADQIRDLIDG